MYLKQCNNLFSYVQRLNRPLFMCSLINPQKCVLSFIRQTATAESSSPRISDSLCQIEEKNIFTAYFHNYLLQNKEKYDLFSIEDMNFEKETKVSLKLLDDFLNNSVETLEDKEIPQELEESINREIREYNADEICKYILLISKLSASTRRTLTTYLESSIHQKALPGKDLLKILYVIKTYTGKHFFNKLLWKTLHKLYFHQKNLTPEQKVLFFFSLIKLDPISTKNVKFNFIASLMEVIPKLNTDELGIIARGFIKCSMNPSDNKLIEVFINKVITEKHNFNDLSLKMTLKMITANVKLENMKDVDNLQEEFIPLIPKFRNQTILSLVGIGIKFYYVNSSFWEVFLKHFENNIDTYEVVELIRLIKLTSAFGHYNNKLFQRGIQNIEALPDLNPNLLILFLSCLVLHKVYPEKLLQKALSEDFRLVNDKIITLTSKYNYAFLHFCLEMDMPINNLMLMDKTEKKSYYKVLLHSNIDRSKNNFWFISTCRAQSVLENNHGENSVLKMQCVPYDDVGLVMRFDKSLKAQPIPEEFKQFDRLNPHAALKDEHYWVFIKLMNECAFSLADGKLNLKTQTLMRHIKLLGYIPIFIKCSDWYQWYKEEIQTENLLNTIQKNLQDAVEKIHK